MQEPAVAEYFKYGDLQKTSRLDLADRIIAVWALSEAALGGILHALRLPFTGLFIGGMAVVFITLLARFDTRRFSILRAMLLVMIVKLLVSPHAPVNAYLAIAFQGLLGTFLFKYIKNLPAAALILGIGSLLQSAFQKLILITLVFGMNFWKATDIFIDFVLSQLPYFGSFAHSVSIIALITVFYVCIHLLFGIIMGIWAPRLARAIEHIRTEGVEPEKTFLHYPSEPVVKPKRKSGFGKKLTYATILMISFSIFALSYFVPVFDQSRGVAALIMVVRSLVILAIWYYFLGPFLMRKLRLYLETKKSRYQNEVTDILNLLPVLKTIIISSWRYHAPLNDIRRLPHFIQSVIIHILTVRI